jgi:hypothetical protein
MEVNSFGYTRVTAKRYSKAMMWAAKNGFAVLEVEIDG